MAHRDAPARPDPSSPWVIDIRDLGRRPGAMRSYHREAAAPAELGLDVIGVPEGRDVSLDVRLESVMEGVLVSGTASAPIAGECARCLDRLSDRVDVELSELFAYPDSATDDTTDPDEVSRVVDDLIDVEPVVRDAVLLALPQVPVCREDCPGLCAECGGKRAELGPDHRHETIDPRWAALQRRFGGSEKENE
ncbi:MAG: DUF177 domain-containing protein [Pseudonocardiaceae bacterium]|nr:DUF177 domain-containing protein [Pseudonocardiaceae bacterium]